MQFLILIIFTIMIIFFLFVNGQQNPLDVFKHQKSYVFHRINKLLLQTSKNNATALLNTLLKPFDPMCLAMISKNYNLDEIELLKIQNSPEFRRLHLCGYIHNMFVLVALSLWAESAKEKTEASLLRFITECIKPITASPNFTNGAMIYTAAKTGVLTCMRTKNI